jgi:hypothetical protein
MLVGLTETVANAFRDVWVTKLKIMRKLIVRTLVYVDVFDHEGPNFIIFLQNVVLGIEQLTHNGKELSRFLC